MKLGRLALAAAALAALGAVLRLGVSSGGGADPDRVLRDALAASGRRPFTAVRVWTWALNGEHHSRTERVRSSGGAYTDALFVQLLRRNYTPLIEGEDTIAGRATWVLRLKPRVKHRPWRQLWVDRETGEVLAMRDWDSRNRLKRTMKTLTIAYGEPGVASGSDRRVPPISDGGRLRSLPRPRYLPRGWKLVGVRDLGNPRAYQLVYSDGLYCISVFLRFPAGRVGEQDGLEPACDWGQGLVMSRRAAGGSATVVADLPPAEIERILRSVR